MSRSERTIEYVDPSSTVDFICSICKQALDDPLETPCCRHAFCALCIRKALSHTAACPLCRRAISTNQLLEPNKTLKGQLERLQVYCLNRSLNQSNNCTWIGNKIDLKVHLESNCDFELWPCPNSNLNGISACSERIYRPALPSHLNICPFEKMKTFYTALAARCDIIAEQTEKSVSNLRQQTEKSVRSLRQQTEKSVRNLPLSFPLPSTPTISGKHYVSVSCLDYRDNGDHSSVSRTPVTTSAIVPGCTYEQKDKRILASLPHGMRSGYGTKERIAAVNLIANMGYSLAHVAWSSSDTRGVRYLMEYTGVEWEKDGLPSAIEWPPYIEISQYSSTVQMEPILPGFSVEGQDALNLIDSLAKHSYRVIGMEHDGVAYNHHIWVYLLQKCLPINVSNPLD